ncbi:MAG: TonB-dependent receptor [Bacteroidales bacterium]|nr:TonB-dependent receptor [Bacteroidales bacterium]
MSGETLPGAVVWSSLGYVAANSHGFYSLPVLPRKDTLTVSYVGYRQERIVVSESVDFRQDIILLPGEELEEAVVSAATYGRAGQHVIPMNDIISAPVVFSEPDVLKALQSLPGVQSGMDGTAGIIVRGGGPDENLFLLDGIPIYNVSHMLGLFSAFSPEAIKKVTLYKGSFPPRFGGRVSSVIDIRTNDGDLQAFHGTISIGLLNSRVHFEGPLVKGKTTASFTARGLNTFFAAPFLEAKETNYRYYFYDLNGKIVHRFSPKDQLVASVYNCRDIFIHKSDEYIVEDPDRRYIAQDGTKMNWGNSLVSLSWNHVAGSKLYMSTSAAWYGYDTYSRFQEWEITTSDNKETFSDFRSDVSDVVIKTDLDYALSPSHSIHGGITGTYHRFIPTLASGVNSSAISVSEETNPEIKYKGWECAAYLEDEMTLFEWLRADAGLRYTLMSTGKTIYPSLQPRISVSADFLKGFTASLSYSRLAQYVHLLSLSQVALPTDMWVPITGSIKPIIADHFCLGVGYRGNSGWEAGAEAYYKYSQNVLEYKNGVSFVSGSNDWGEMVEMGEAVSRGLELFLKKDAGKMRGSLSYCLSKTDRRFPGGSINNGEWFPYHYDRRHSIMLDLRYQLNKDWDFSAAWSFASGCKITVPTRKLLESTVHAFAGIYQVIDGYGTKNNYTLPPSHHLDVSANWHRKLRHGRRTLSIGIYNVYNAMNPNMVVVAYDRSNKLTAKQYTYLPIIPSFSYTYQF